MSLQAPEAVDNLIVIIAVALQLLGHVPGVEDGLGVEGPRRDGGAGLAQALREQTLHTKCN